MIYKNPASLFAGFSATAAGQQFEVLTFPDSDEHGGGCNPGGRGASQESGSCGECCQASGSKSFFQPLTSMGGSGSVDFLRAEDGFGEDDGDEIDQQQMPWGYGGGGGGGAGEGRVDHLIEQLFKVRACASLFNAPVSWSHTYTIHSRVVDKLQHADFRDFRTCVSDTGSV